MLKMTCPNCGSPAESIEPDKIDRMLRGEGPYHGVNVGFARAPIGFKIARFAVIGGRELYKRLPKYGGAKRCTNPACAHCFH